MGNFGRFGGGQPNMQALMRQAQKMQEEAIKAQQELEDTEVDGIAQNGLVKVCMNGSGEVVSINIDKTIVDPEDVEMLQDLIMTAINEALRKVDDASNDAMGKYNIPGLM